MGFRALALVTLLGLISACSSEHAETEKQVPLDYRLHNVLLDENSEPIEGMEICVDGRSDIPCVTTDSLGVGDLDLPKHTKLLVSYAKDGFITKLRPLTTGEEPAPGLGVWVVQRRTWYEDIFMQGAAPPGSVDLDGHGLIGLQVGSLINQPSELYFDTDAVGAIGPFRFCVSGAKLVYCPQFSDNDTGAGGFAHVPPGKVRAYLRHGSLKCTAQENPCPDGAEGCAEVEVHAGALTHHMFDCL